MRYKAAIFDLDGTLLDSMSIWSNLCREFLLRHDIEGDVDLDSKLGVLSMRNALEYLIREFELAVSLEDACAETWQIIGDFYQTKAQIKPAVKLSCFFSLLDFSDSKLTKIPPTVVTVIIELMYPLMILNSPQFL